MTMLLGNRAKRREAADERTAGVSKWVQLAGAVILITVAIIAMMLLAKPADGQPTPPNTLESFEVEAGWMLIFDGVSMEGWRGYNREDLPGGWQAEDGTLTRAARGGDIIYGAKQFVDFDLRIDWKVQEGGNSGVFYRAEEGVNAIFKSAVEMQVLDDANHVDGRSPLTSAGAVYGLYPAPRGVVKPAGEWNSARVIARGPHVEHWLNGVKVGEYELGSPEWNALLAGSKFVEWPEFGTSLRGYIGLQDHGDQVWYRNIKIRELR